MTTDFLSPEQVVSAGLLPFGNADWIRQQLRTGRLRGSKLNGRWVTTADAITEMVGAGTNSTTRRRRRRTA